jgi:N-acyl amino acid synthase FeeM
MRGLIVRHLNTTTPNLSSIKINSLLGLKLDTNIFVRKAENKEDLIRLFEVRWKGYSKYFNSREEIVDKFDFATNVTLLLAENDQHNTVGTLRILNRGYGSIELDEFVDVDSLLPEGEERCAEVTRFSIPTHPQAKSVKFLLWKAFLLYCLKNKINIILISGSPVVARAYRSLFFEEAGPSGIYYHRNLGNLEHRCFMCNIAQKSHILKEKNRPLYDFFFEEDHPNINKSCYPIFNKNIINGRIRIQRELIKSYLHLKSF